MTPCNKIKREILIAAATYPDLDFRPFDTDGQVEEAYWKLLDTGNAGNFIYDVRRGEVETDISCGSSRHYEAKSVAMKCCDGSWVGWTFWYGGGKHGEPESVPWMEDAYNLLCTEETKLVTVQTFEKID